MYKKLTAMVAAVAFMASITGCAENKRIGDVEYETYGLANQAEKQNPEIQYDISWGNFIWGIVLIETIVAPIYFFGFSLYEPVGKKPEIKGQAVH